MLTSTTIVISSALKFLSVSSSSSLRSDIKQIRDCFFFLFLICTFIVVAGVILEEIEFRTIRPYIDAESGAFNPARTIKFAALGLWLVVIGIAGEGLFEMATSWTDGLSEDFSNSLLLNAEALTGNAAKSATTAHDEAVAARDASGEAQKKADVVGKQANELSRKLLASTKQLETVDAKRAELEKSLINLAVCTAPRVISSWLFSGSKSGARSYVDSLRPMAGQIVFIEFVPDSESRRAAITLERTLSDAKWNVQKPLRAVDGLEDGVSVQPSWSEVTGGISDLFLRSRATDVTDKLLDFLHSYNWQATRGWPSDPEGKLIRDEKILPAGAIRIQVGLYPPTVYVSPPGQKEFTSSMEEWRRKREEMRAEFKRKDEERRAMLPPETRKELERADKELEAKIKSETSNGPCQVLNPPF